jgi:hypothetical protein
MENNQSSQIISNSEAQNEIASSEAQNGSLRNHSETILRTQQVSVINPENNNSLVLKKWIIACSAGVLAITFFFLFAKETDVCFLSTCNHYSDSIATGSTSVGNEFLVYAGSAATLVTLTTIGVPLIPAFAVSTGIWFFVHLIH